MKRFVRTAVLLGISVYAIFVVSMLFYEHSRAHIFSLTILHFNDFHSRLLPSTYLDGSPCIQGPTCVGGIARLKTLIEQEKHRTKHVLVLSSGDMFQGSIYFSLLREPYLAHILNSLGIDALSFGNHEFDDGINGISEFAEGITFPLITGNVHIRDPKGALEKEPPYMIRSIDGTKVAIISAVTASTTELSSPGNDFTFEDAAAYLMKTSKMLHDQGILIIVALTHVGYEEDQQIAKENPYIDVIVGGHSDTLLSNVQARSEGPYPTIVRTAQGHQTAIVQTAPYGTQLGELQVTFDQNGEISSATGEPIIVASGIIPDPAVDADVASATKKIASEASSTVATATKAIEGDPQLCRKEECEVGDLLADSLQAYGLTNNAHIALINSGSIRSSINQGTIRKEDIVTAIPFNEPVSVMSLTGQQLAEMIMRSFAQSHDDSGAFLQLAGLRILLSATSTQGESVCSIIDTLSNTVIDPRKTYRVVTNTYLAHGGDGYTVDQDHVEQLHQNVYDVLENYLKNKQYYSKDLDGRMSATCN